MLANQNLISFHLVERIGNKNIITWTYPTITEEMRDYLLSKCFTLSKNSKFFCLRRNFHWIYVTQNLNDALVIISDYCNLGKYQAFAEILMRKYLKNKNPVDLVRLYLDGNLSGGCSIQDNGNLISCNLKNFKQQTKVQELVENFGIETILLYTSLLLKRRTLVYCDDLEKLQEKMMSIASLVSCRNLKDLFLPYIENWSDLKGYSFYLAGTTDETLIKKDHLYDLFVNLHLKEIFISERTKDVFNMTKIQKNIANFLVEALETKICEEDFHKDLDKQTNNILKTLRTMANNNSNLITIDDLKSKNLNKNLENFLFNLGVAENIVML
ncbi:unnamed protein product [Brassicogethes aeneus]|uniref:UDENN domain-containing protein n=1 Tax=Brassicogethes aeneus TaxID=1431903 RepID=A0A9P0FJH5_BRAAE|nr:unnamed protein product [Brassicogethes aeneus]